MTVSKDFATINEYRTYKCTIVKESRQGNQTVSSFARVIHFKAGLIYTAKPLYLQYTLQDGKIMSLSSGLDAMESMYMVFLIVTSLKSGLTLAHLNKRGVVL